MRNMWALLEKFNVFPTNEDFRNLDDDQIELIFLSMEQDSKEADRRARGVKSDGEWEDDSFEEEVWNAKDWDIVKEGHDMDDIARQVNALTQEEDKKNLLSKFDSLDEYNEYLENGGKTVRESETEDYINRQIIAAQEKAKMLEANGQVGRKLVDDKDLPEAKSNEGLSDGISDLDKQAIEDSIKLFNDEDDDDYTPL